MNSMHQHLFTMRCDDSNKQSNNRRSNNNKKQRQQRNIIPNYEIKLNQRLSLKGLIK